MTTPQESNVPPAPIGVQEEQSYSLVLVGGLATTALALLGVYLLDTKTQDFHIMGWYANYILPVGALIVGAAASSGYGLGSWLSGIKITRGLLLAVLALQLAAYFAAQYIEFASHHLVHRNGKAVGFFEYFDFAARSFAWKQHDGSGGKPLGLWGYAFRGLEILGFAAGGLLVPALLSKTPYCEPCRRYMRTRQLGLVAGSVPVKKVKKSDLAGQAAHQAEQEEAFAGGKRTCETLRQLAASNQPADFLKAVAELGPQKKQTAKLPIRFILQLVSCPRCHSGSLRTCRLAMQGRNVTQAELARTELQPEFVRAMGGRSS